MTDMSGDGRFVSFVHSIEKALRDDEQPDSIANKLNAHLKERQIFDLVVPISNITRTKPLAFSGEYSFRFKFTSCKFTDVFFTHSIHPGIFFEKCDFKSIRVETKPKVLVFDRCNIERLEIIKGNHSYVPFLQLIRCPKVTEARLDDLEFASVSVVESDIGDFSARNSTFLGTSDFVKNNFRKAPEFYRATLHPMTTFHRSEFFDTTEGSAPRYRQLKVLMDQAKNEVEESVFGALELECRYKGLDWKRDRIEKFLSLWYSWLNDYGRSPFKPGLWILGQFVVAFFIHYAFERVSSGWLFHADIATTPIEYRLSEPLPKSLWTAFVGVLGPLRLLGSLNIVPPSSISGILVSWMEVLFSTLFWFLLIAGIRRRFRTH